MGTPCAGPICSARSSLVLIGLPTTRSRMFIGMRLRLVEATGDLRGLARHQKFYFLFDLRNRHRSELPFAQSPVKLGQLFLFEFRPLCNSHFDLLTRLRVNGNGLRRYGTVSAFDNLQCRREIAISLLQSGASFCFGWLVRKSPLDFRLR